VGVSGYVTFIVFGMAHLMVITRSLVPLVVCTLSYRTMTEVNKLLLEI
jgi:hypothetical protein